MPINPQDPRFAASFGAPTPGESLNTPIKNSAWGNPPQFVKLEDAMNFLMDQLTDSTHLKPLMDLMESGMSLEAMARTILFSGFALGKWTVNLAMLMYKPLLLSLIAIAHRAGMKDLPVVMVKAFNKTKNQDLFRYMAAQKLGQQKQPNKPENNSTQAPNNVGNGFMKRGS